MSSELPRIRTGLGREGPVFSGLTVHHVTRVNGFRLQSWCIIRLLHAPHLLHEITGRDKPQPPRSPLVVQGARRCSHVSEVLRVRKRMKWFVNVEERREQRQALPSILPAAKLFHHEPAINPCLCSPNTVSHRFFAAYTLHTPLSITFFQIGILEVCLTVRPMLTVNINITRVLVAPSRRKNKQKIQNSKLKPSKWGSVDIIVGGGGSSWQNDPFSSAFFCAHVALPRRPLPAHSPPTPRLATAPVSLALVLQRRVANLNSIGVQNLAAIEEELQTANCKKNTFPPLASSRAFTHAREVGTTMKPRSSLGLAFFVASALWSNEGSRQVVSAFHQPAFRNFRQKSQSSALMLPAPMRYVQ